MALQTKKSLFWQFFSEISKNQVKCKFCGALVKLGGGTSNLKGHLERNHIWTSGDNNSTLPIELNFYLSQPLLPRHQDPMKYWTSHQHAFPTVYPIAIRYLTVCGASVASERVVSTLNNVCSDKRNRLTPTHVNSLVFLGSLGDEFWKI